jgi:hypothetical protein
MTELECPVCKNYFRYSIIMCKNGHNVCGNCRPHLEECPVCRSRFLDCRNRTLEILVSRMERPCIYRSFGCTTRAILTDIEAHESTCCLRHLNDWKNCSWVQILATMMTYILEQLCKSIYREKRKNRNRGNVMKGFGNATKFAFVFLLIVFLIEIFGNRSR